MSTLADYRDREHWSYSSLNQFLNICSLQWAFDRLYRIERAFTPLSLVVGSVFHRVMEWAALLRREGKSPCPKEGAAMFGDLFSRKAKENRSVRFEEDSDAGSVALQGGALAACAIASMDPEEEVLSVNRAFAVPLIDRSGLSLHKPLVGEFDAVVRKDGREVLIDWKTSARRWPKDQAGKSLQPTAYLYARRQMGESDGVFRFDVTVKNKTPVAECHETLRSQDHFDRMVELAKRAESMIDAEHFLPNEQGFYCNGCPFQEPCRAWHRQSTRMISLPKAA